MTTVEQYLQSAWRIHQSGHPGQALAMYRQVVEQHPMSANGWCYLGIALHDLKRYRDAVAAYEKAIAIQPLFPIAYNNMGNSLRYDLRPEEAEAAFQKALMLDPNYLSAHKNRGTLHAWLGHYDQALESYHHAMQLSPNEAETHRNLGVIYLLKGDFQRGWREYRWRWKCKEAIQTNYSQPKWSGEPLQGKTILLYAEQGLGDTLHFIRFASTLKDQGAKTIVHAQPPLMPLLQKMFGIDRFIPNSLPVDCEFDYHCSLLDVADILALDDSSFPYADGYLQPAGYLVDYWKDWLDRLPNARARVGLVWQGNRDHQADKFRSLPLQAMVPLADLDDVQFIVLQKGFGSEQTDVWPQSRKLIRLPENVDETSGAFMDTAAIVSQLDLVITTDTSMAHLCGAIGAPAWVLLNKMPDWRWLLDRNDSPWYRSLRLFRQTTQSDWASVVGRVHSELRQLLSRNP